MKKKYKQKWLCFLLALVMTLIPTIDTLAKVVITEAGSSIFEEPFTQTSGSIGVMIIMVEFADASFSDEDPGQKVQQIFRDGGFGSLTTVKEYYEKASYGALYMDMVVQRLVTVENTREYYEQYPDELVWECMMQIQDRGVTLSSFDENYDGYLDMLYIVAAGDVKDESSFWWPHTDTYYGGFEVGDTMLGGCCFLSYELLVSESSVLQHSAIHETGHLFGLADYYTTVTTSGTGTDTMMDLSSGDQDCFSKMLLGWTNPQIVNSTGSYRITSESTTSDALLIAAEDWDGNLLGEYYMVEYITPEANQKNQVIDSQGNVRVWHVDAATSTFTNDVSIDMYRNSNASTGDKLLSVVDTTHPWYKAGEVIQPSQMVFHDGTDAGIRIRIASMDGTTAVIEVTYGQTDSEIVENSDAGNENSSAIPDESTSLTDENNSQTVTDGVDSKPESNQATDNQSQASVDPENEENTEKIFSFSKTDDIENVYQVKGNVQLKKPSVATILSMAIALVVCILLLRGARNYKSKGRRRYK